MICIECRNDKPENCLGVHKDKTWCDNQHVVSRAFVDPTQCKHIGVPDSPRVCPSCSRVVPLTMTKEQAMCLLFDFRKECDSEIEFDELIKNYAERILNDRPTRSAEQAKEASISGM